MGGLTFKPIIQTSSTIKNLHLDIIKMLVDHHAHSKKPYKMRLVIDETITEDMDNKSKPKVTNVNPDTLVNNNLW